MALRSMRSTQTSGRRGPPAVRSPWLLLASACGLVACVTAIDPSIWGPHHRTAAVDGASELVGAEECETCHEDIDGLPVATTGHEDCEACHGPGELHIDSEEVAEIRFPANEDCNACHEDRGRTLIGWSTSEHDRTGVLCSDCHATHGREPQHVKQAEPVAAAVMRHAGDTTRLCASCHAEVAARFDLPSHHPMREGMLVCTDCHRPHEGRRSALGAATEQCTSCHQDYAGPWIYEHGPVTEDCGYCHAPHGTSAPSLLETNEPGACISCHTVALSGAVHDPFAFATRCSDCHSAIHGSYTDPYLRR